MKNQIFFFLIICLIVSLLGNYIQIRSAVQQQNYRDQDNSRFQVEQSKKLGQLKARDSVISSLLNDRKSDSTKYASEQKSLRTRINSLRAKVTGPAVVQDTIIVYQDSLIASISSERDTLYLRDDIAFDSLQSSVDQLKKMYRQQWNRADKAEFVLEREKKKRISIGPHVGYSLKGPDFGISVQYSLWRF